MNNNNSYNSQGFNLPHFLAYPLVLSIQHGVCGSLALGFSLRVFCQSPAWVVLVLDSRPLCCSTAVFHPFLTVTNQDRFKATYFTFRRFQVEMARVQLLNSLRFLCFNLLRFLSLEFTFLILLKLKSNNHFKLFQIQTALKEGKETTQFNVGKFFCLNALLNQHKYSWIF